MTTVTAAPADVFQMSDPNKGALTFVNRDVYQNIWHYGPVREDGRAPGHLRRTRITGGTAESLILLPAEGWWGVYFQVEPHGLEKLRAGRRRHPNYPVGYAVGRLADELPEDMWDAPLFRVEFNWRNTDTFTRQYDGAPVSWAMAVLFYADGTCWAVQ